jgi:cytochrome d ubiquinol oxidase subunit II
VTAVELLWFAMGAGVVAYALTGGADFGGGVLHLFAFGPRAGFQRKTVERAIAPIWEANHVWLIFVVVALFTTFPRAFAVLGIALHVPVTLALLGIVFRGASFVFHSYDLRETSPTRGWGRVFGVSSLITPVFLGDCLGALSTGAIRWDGERVTSGYFAGWLSPFALGTGLFALLLFTLLAAVYLTIDSDGEVREDFRRRAVGLEVATGVAAAAVLVLAHEGAPVVFAGLASSPLAIAAQVTTAAAAVTAIAALGARRFQLARAAVVCQAALVVIGWGLSMRGQIVVPDVRLDNAGAREEVARVVLVALVGGAALLVPALTYLFRVFKKPA